MPWSELHLASLPAHRSQSSQLSVCTQHAVDALKRSYPLQDLIAHMYLHHNPFNALSLKPFVERLEPQAVLEGWHNDVLEFVGNLEGQSVTGGGLLLAAYLIEGAGGLPALQHLQGGLDGTDSLTQQVGLILQHNHSTCCLHYPRWPVMCTIWLQGGIMQVSSVF